MWLINANTKELCEFEDPVPPYAILSHRWGNEELNFREVHKRRIDSTKQGYPKFVDACRIANGYNVRYLWIDTCCIDKRSSAELSEAINSMFMWYKNAVVCLAFLDDVESSEIDVSFGQSVWFTRAWTLQELLAPRQVVFYNRFRTVIANKHSDVATIAGVTSIPAEVLSGALSLWSCDFVRKMSWAAERQATRVEDTAYSLMGIFDLHMPMLYGEGERAFVRLQEEVIRNASSPMFLLWGVGRPTLRLLAKSPEEFHYYTKGKAGILRQGYGQSFSLTNLGLEIEADVVRFGIGLYGIDVGMTDPHCFVLLLHKSPYRPETFYKVGVARVDQVSHRDFKSKKITVMRGTNEQGLGVGMDRLSHDYQSLGKPYRVEFYSKTSISISPIQAPRRAESQFESPEWSRNDDFEGAVIATWFQPVRKGIASVDLGIEGQLLSLEFFFDWDSVPCLLFRLRDDERSQRGLSKLRWPNTSQRFGGEFQEEDSRMATRQKLFETCDSKIVKWSAGRKERFQMQCVETKDVPGGPYFLVRGHYCGHSFARLPNSMLHRRGLCVSMIEPPSDKLDSAWCISFTDVPLLELNTFIPW